MPQRGLRISDVRRAYLLSHPFAFSLSVLTTLLGLLFVLSPATLNATAIGGRIPGQLDEGWALMFVLAGCLMIYGMWNLTPSFEVAGCILMGALLLLDVVILVQVRGFAAASLTGGIMGSVAIAFAVRAYVLLAFAKVLVAPVPGPLDDKATGRR